MDVKYINPFILSTKKVFAQMVNVDLRVGHPFLKPKDVEMQRLYSLSATIELSGPVMGKVVLSMSEPVTLAVASGLLCETIKSIGDDCYDAIAEVTNMIAGGAKKEIASTEPISLSIPKVMPTRCLVYPDNMPTLVIPFDTATGRLVLQVAMLPSKPQNSDDPQKSAA